MSVRQYMSAAMAFIGIAARPSAAQSAAAFPFLQIAHPVQGTVTGLRSYSRDRSVTKRLSATAGRQRRAVTRATVHSEVGEPSASFITSASILRSELAALKNPSAPLAPTERIARFRTMMDEMIPDLQRDMPPPLSSPCSSSWSPGNDYRVGGNSLSAGWRRGRRWGAPPAPVRDGSDAVRPGTARNCALGRSG